MVLNAIKYGVDSKQFSLIASSKSVREAWDTLLVIHEGSKEGKDHISEPFSLITHLKNTTTGGQKQEVLE